MDFAVRTVLPPQPPFARFLGQGDNDEAGGAGGELAQGELAGLEELLQRGPHDDQQCKQQLHHDAQGQPLVRGPLPERGLPSGRARQRGANLAQDKRPVVGRHAGAVRHGVGDGILGGVLLQGEELVHLGHDPHKHHPACDALDDAHVTIGIEKHAAVHHPVALRVARLPTHELPLGWLASECDGRPDVCTDVDEQDLRSRQRRGNPDELGKSRQHLGELRAEGVHDGLPQVAAAETALLNAVDD
mmetsp:Transcript_59673/g.171131  ORF Transcript_59673/g.171131 Transcript_59673/m.171131 type:complete len:245 (-) Transcript_59673:188-922(-)